MTSGVTLELASVSPAVVLPGTKLVISGVIHNATATALPKPVIRLVAREVNLNRDEVREWATATGPAEGAEVGRTALSSALTPGASAPFKITVAGLAGRGPSTYGALPLSIETGGTSLRTFVGYQRLKQYQPMSIAWAAPLTLDPDPNLFAQDGPDREVAWAQALGPQSRLSRVLDATSDAPVTWAVDPTLTPSLLPASVDTVPTTTQESVLRATTEARITTGAARHTPWVLPDTDADVGTLTGSGEGQSLMATLIGRAATVADALGGRADVAWPADGGSTTSTEAGLRALYRTPPLAGQVTPASSRSGGVGATPGAAQRSTSGLPLLAYDDGLSALLTRTTSPSEGALSAQQFIAESAAILNELPGTQGRTLLVAAPRTFNPDPDTAKAFFAAAASVPWLVPTTTNAELASARTAVPSAAAPVTKPANPQLAASPAILTPARMSGLEQTLRTVRGVAQVREDGARFARVWARSAEQLASTRWRSSPVAWNTVNGRILAAAQQTTTAVKVSASTINFLADTGRLQITVTNGLDVPVRDVKLTVEASNPRLRIDSQPPVVRIGANSKATVNVGVTALAAGVVPLRTTLTTPDGTVIGQGADVQVRVTPTGDWVYWVLGGLAGIILVLGIVRSFTRRPRSRPAEPLPRKARP
ncbi:DUF6049 family protein [Nostocoides sp. HKS02]|uniref:DUF6049 family protein n=1 Tax=Nostocoides sp. HKS02 TaxID=1813880 RepID=UPI00351B3A5D